MVLGGLLFKIAAVPMHIWSPDVYEAAPVPVIAFFSVVPKLAGVAILFHFVSVLQSVENNVYDWRLILAGLSFLTMTVGNFAALLQKNPKRMMAYSSIAQTGFLLAGMSSLIPASVPFILFYSTVYLLMNFLVFLYIQYFERHGIVSIEGYSGVGKIVVWPSVFCLVGLIALTGLPPTAGFTGKLFIFSSLWQSYTVTSQTFLLGLMIFGLLNTVVSLFFYLKIPYYAFLKAGEPLKKQNNLTFENLLGLILVLLVLVLFFQPGLLMGWINKIIFVL
jgi:NADH-quinone oxidoreductase subunit N